VREQTLGRRTHTKCCRGYSRSAQPLSVNRHKARAVRDHTNLIGANSCGTINTVVLCVRDGNLVRRSLRVCALDAALRLCHELEREAPAAFV
jgi:hypothetical protein